jgi:hypothetical protein
MSREVRGLMRYLEAVCTTMFLSRRIEVPDAEALGLPETYERLAILPADSSEGWRTVARVLRHLQVAADEQGHPAGILVHELYLEVMRRADRAAARSQIGG